MAHSDILLISKPYKEGLCSAVGIGSISINRLMRMIVTYYLWRYPILELCCSLNHLLFIFTILKVVFVEINQTVHENMTSPYAQKEVKAELLLKTASKR
jgi:hypothetical protein